MESAGEINMSDSLTRFCVLWTAIKVTQSAIRNFIAAWNKHRIPGHRGGIPNVLLRRANRTTRLDPATIPDTPMAVQLHEQNGHQLTRESFFGTDPLFHHPQLPVLRKRDFTTKHPRMKDIMSSLLHGNFDPFKLAITDFIHLTKSYGSVIGN